MKNFIKAVVSFIMPIAIIVLSFVLLRRIEGFHSSWLMILKLSPYIFLGIAMMLGCFFNRGQVFFTALTLGVSFFILSSYMTAIFNIDLHYTEVFSFIAVLIPLNIIIFSLLKERGIFTLWGKIRIAFIALQFGFIYWVIVEDKKEVIDLITKDIVLLKIFDSILIPQIAMFTILLGAICLLVKKIRKRTILETSFLGVLAVITVALHNNPTSMYMEIFFGAAGLMMIIALLQTSYSMAYMDELTGLPARRALREQLMKLGSKYTIAMLDIDHFKKFNDKYGHDIGDEVLKLVASSLGEVEGGGRAFRYGGEEFTVVFPNKKLEEVLPHLEELRERVSKRGYSYRGKGKSKKRSSSKTPARQLFVTISIGVAEKNSSHKSPNDVVKAADTALYRAKKKGRNCVSK